MNQAARSVGRPANNTINAIERVIDSACNNFAKHGIKGTSNQMIGDDAGVTPAMVHYYFKTKEDLHKAVLDSLLEPLLKKMDGVDSLDSWVNIFHGHLCEHPWAPHLMAREVLIYNGQLRPLYLKLYGQTFFGIIKSLVVLESTKQKVKKGFDLERHILLLISLIVFPFLGMQIGESLTGRKFDSKMQQGFKDDALNLFKNGIAGD